jgi:hypothetical protein
MNQTFLQWLKPEQVEVDVVRLEEPNEVEIKASDLNELCSYVGIEKTPRLPKVNQRLTIAGR